MRLAYFTHSMVSDWNHGNAHFQRGVLTEWIARGHEAVAWEPDDGWSRSQLLCEAPEAEETFARQFPLLRSRIYRSVADLDAALDGVDLVIVHEWTAPTVVREIGRARSRGGRFRALFHDTHHRAVSDPEAMAAYDLADYDGVLVFGNALREIYEARGWGRRVWTWHEAADVRVFHPLPEIAADRDVVWIGNWGDEERTAELETFLFRPAEASGATLDVYGVRYPDSALARLIKAGARYHGWLPNAEVPKAFARSRMTIHVPRCFYVRALPGVPTIRVFEALACGIPLISAPWEDREGLFRPGGDFLVADTSEAVAHGIALLKNDPDAARSLAASGLARIRERHTCAHRVDELFAILDSLAAPLAETRRSA